MLKRCLISSFAVALLIALALPDSAPASKKTGREFPEIYIECGLGAMIAPKHPPVAAVTNVTWDSGTTAISSDLTTPDACKGVKARSARFINESYPALEKDLASGSGKYLDSLMAVAGCAPSVHQDLTAMLRADFTDFVAAPGYDAKSHIERAGTLHKLLHKNIDESFASSCSAPDVG